MRTGLCTLLMVLTTGLIRAEPPEVSVVGLASIRIADLWDAEKFKSAAETLDSKALRFRAEILRVTGLAPGEIERITLVQFKVAAGENELAPEPLWVIVPRKSLDVKAFARNRKEVVAKGKLDGLPSLAILEDDRHVRCAVSDKLVVILSTLGEEETRLAIETAMIAKALKRDADRATVLARDKLMASISMDVPELMRSGSLPGDDGIPAGVPETLQPLLKARIASLTVELNQSLSVKGELTFATAADAAAAKPALDLASRQFQHMLGELLEKPAETRDEKTQHELLRFAAALLAGTTVTVADRTATVTTSRDLTADLAKTAADGIILAETSMARVQSQNNLRQIVMASQNAVQDGTTGLIENICDDKGKPLLSWRVRLLPFMDHKELYDQFKLDEPWDSEHNKKLIAKMPKEFVLPTAKETKEGMTFFQAFVGKKGQAARPILQDGEARGLSYNGITDGVSTTLLVVEATDAVTWTKPQDIPFDNEGKLPKIGGHFDGGFNAGFCDGSVRFLKHSMPEATIKALITANGGEEVSIDD